MNPSILRSSRETCAALGLAVVMTFSVLLSMGALADRYHADEALAQGAASTATQAASASVPALRG